MFVAEGELNAVAADVFRAEHREIFGYRSRIEYTKASHFANAVGAHALGSKVLDWIHADVPVIPSDGDLVCAGLLYLEGCGHFDA